MHKNIIANYFIQNSMNKADKKFGGERKWIQQLQELTSVSTKSNTKTLHKGKMVDIKDIKKIN